jgi:aquaporin Z
MVSVTAAVSGGHLNPAITLSALIGRKIRPVDALGYVACQILGALGAALTLRVVFAEAAWRPSNLGAPGLAVSSGKGVLVEAILTFFLALVVWGTAIDERGPRVGGFAIGLTVMAVILGAGPLTGAALNPARYLGPAAVADSLSDWWVYFVGPGIGAAVAGVLYPTVFWSGFPWARVGGSPAVTPAPESTPPKAGARKASTRPPASRKR